MIDLQLPLSSSIIHALVGGVFIGIAASLLLLFNGRVFGISGITATALFPDKAEAPHRGWRIAVVAGLMAAGLFLMMVLPQSVQIIAEAPLAQYAVAGLLVGFGTQLGSGCTSGHGVCGISRFSRRSIIATITFIISGMLTVALVRMLEQLV